MSNQVTLLLPCYLVSTIADWFRAQGFTVFHVETYEEMEQLVAEHKNDIDIAIEWQRGVDCFPLLDLFKKHNVTVPLFLSLNWDLKIPEKYNELGYAGTLVVPFEIAEMKEKFYAMLPDEKKILLKQMAFWESH